VEDKQHEMVIKREEAKLEKAKERLEALKNGAANKLAQMFRDENIKQNIAREGKEAINRNRNGDTQLSRYAQQRGGEGGMFGTNVFGDEIITGNEPRPWEADE
jgi:hypothetical protein